MPPQDPERPFEVHQFDITRNGIYHLENLDLEQLAADKVHEFAFVFSPLRLKGASGLAGQPDRHPLRALVPRDRSLERHGSCRDTTLSASNDGRARRRPLPGGRRAGRRGRAHGRPPRDQQPDGLRLARDHARPRVPGPGRRGDDRPGCPGGGRSPIGGHRPGRLRPELRAGRRDPRDGGRGRDRRENPGSPA